MADAHFCLCVATIGISKVIFWKSIPYVYQIHTFSKPNKYLLPTIKQRLLTPQFFSGTAEQRSELSLELDVADVHNDNDGAGSNVPADADARIQRRPTRNAADGSGCIWTDVLYVDVFEVPSPNERSSNTFHKTTLVR